MTDKTRKNDQPAKSAKRTSRTKAARKPFRFAPTRLAHKLPLAAMLGLTVMAAGVGTASYVLTSNMAVEEAHIRAEAAAHGRAEEFSAYLQSIAQDMRFLADNVTVVQAMGGFVNAFDAFGDSAQQTLQRQFIAENPFPTGEKHKLDEPKEQSFYAQFHANYHPTLRKFQEERGYYDIFLFNTKGDVIYSVFKETDFATNVVNGQWRDTGLGEAFRGAMQGGGADGMTFVDFAAYAPSAGAPASFIARPVQKDGQVIGVVAAQMPADVLQSILSRESGLGEFGETLLVRQDGTLLSDSRFTEGSDVLNAKLDMPFLAPVFAGEDVNGDGLDLMGRDVIVGANPVTFGGQRWATVAMANTDEMLSAVHHLRNTLILITIFGVAVMAGAAMLGARSIVRRMTALNGAVARLANGENGVALPGAEHNDELGEIARSMRAIDDENVKTLRLKSALDSCQTNVMVADANLNIMYANQTLMEMMRNAETDIRAELPQFDTKKLIGAHIDIFHKNPSHQRNMLAGLSSTHRASIQVGVRKFDLIVNPISDASGVKVGFVVEWNDVTAERAVEEEIDQMVAAAASGDFSQRIPVENKTGFHRNLAESMNHFCQTTSSAITEVADALGALAEGDLTRRVESAYGGLFEKLKNDANATSEQLSRIVGDIMGSADEVSAAADEISTGTNDLSTRTEQQASNLQETAASMEEMASTIRQNAENAQQANQLSTGAREVAMKGGDIVQNAIQAMNRIEDSSQKVADIIGVIDEIAFQTNLLALNAAVEAARASEVRTLAQRSSQAAKDIKALIVDSGAQVKDGVELVHNTGKSLDEIVDSIKRLSDIVSEISAASNEQSTGAEQINRAISQMDEMTQQNAALVEESAASAKTLLEQARGMRQRMTYFKIDGHETVSMQAERVKADFVARTTPKPAPRTVAPRKAAAAAPVAVVASEDDGWEDF